MTTARQPGVQLRVGSMLWYYVAVVVASAAAVLVLALRHVQWHDVAHLATIPAMWLIVAPMIVTAVQPVVPGRPGTGGSFAVSTFVFALLLRVGLPVAALCCVVSMALSGVVARQALHRALFNIAQYVLSISAASAVLHVYGITATAGHPWSFTEPHIRLVEIIAGGLAAVTYLIVNNGSVYIAMALSESRSLRLIIREDERHLLFVCFALVSMSPLVLLVMVHMWPLVALFYPALLTVYHNANKSAVHEHDALHDQLTGLGNRELLHREAVAALDDLDRGGRGLAVLVLDVDKFKQVNDTLGHAAGDRLLQVVAERLLAAVRPGDVVARVGGDEFVILVRGVFDPVEARTTAIRILERVNGSFQVHGVSLELATSVGVALAPRDGREFAALLRRADHAMYIAKGSGCGVAVFDPSRDRDRRLVDLETSAGAQGSVAPI